MTPGFKPFTVIIMITIIIIIFFMKCFSHTDKLYLNLIKTTQNFSEIMHKKKTSILMQISGKPLHNSKFQEIT